MANLSDLIDIFLQPGEYFVGDANYKIRTVLGSCVAITLWYPPLCIGAMSHFLLPTRGVKSPSDNSLDGRYGEEALELMVSELLAQGIPPNQCQAKIFGGGNMFPDLVRASQMNIGRRNGEVARELLRKRGIPVLSESLFGVGHRQVIFDVSSGDVWCLQLRPSANEGSVA